MCEHVGFVEHQRRKSPRPALSSSSTAGGGCTCCFVQIRDPRRQEVGNSANGDADTGSGISASFGMGFLPLLDELDR